MFDEKFDDTEITLTLKKVSKEPQLVFIPINEDEGILAVVKPYGLGQASCVAFAPATNRTRPFDGFRPAFLRKTMTNDFALRQGAWTPLSLDSANAVALRNAVLVLMNDIEHSNPESIKQIDMSAPANTSSAPDVAFANYRAPEHTPFELALSHLLGITNSRQTTHAHPTQGEDTATA